MENTPNYHIKPHIRRAPWQRMEAAPLHLWHWPWAAPGASILALFSLLSGIFPVLDRRQTILHALFILKLWPYNTVDLHLLIELVRAGSDWKLQPSENSPMPTDQDLLRSSCFRHNEHHLRTHHVEFTQLNLVPDPEAHLSLVSILLRWVCASLLSVWYLSHNYTLWGVLVQVSFYKCSPTLDARLCVDFWAVRMWPYLWAQKKEKDPGLFHVPCPWI